MSLLKFYNDIIFYCILKTIIYIIGYLYNIGTFVNNLIKSIILCVNIVVA